MPRLDKVNRERAIGMLDAGVSQGEVARRFGVHRTTINRLVSRVRNTQTTDDRPRSGRPRVTSHVQDRFIRLRSLRNRFANAVEIAADLPFRRRISSKTVLRRLAAIGLRPRRPYRGPLFVQRHLRQRLQWARRFLRWTIRQWGRVLFSDESRFLLRRVDGRARVLRRPGERFRKNCVLRHDRYGGGSVMVWGGITAHGRTDLVFINGTLNAQKYRQDILTPHVVPFIRRNGGTFQQDNARPHVARDNMDYLRRNNIDVLPWPALSPDLSPIEHLWDQLDRRVRKRRQQPATLDQLRAALTEEWQRIPQASINRLIASMRRRCVAVINNRGAFTRY